MNVRVKTENLLRLFSYEFTDCRIKRLSNHQYGQIFGESQEKTYYYTSVDFKYKKLIINELKCRSLSPGKKEK